MRRPVPRRRRRVGASSFACRPGCTRSSPALQSESVSLNGYITSRLDESVGWSRAGESLRPGRAAPVEDARGALVANAVAVLLAASAAIVILLVALLT